MRLEVHGKSVFAATGGLVFDPGKPVLAMVHGAGMDHTVWSMQARFFAHHGYAVLNVDLPGHGRSEGPAPLTIPDYANWLAAVITALGGAPAHLIGHSMGSLVALALAARSEGLVARLALLGTAPHIRVHPDLLSAAHRGDHAAYESIVGWGIGRRAQLGGHRSPGVWVAGASMRLLESGRNGVLANDLAACDAWTGGLAAARRLSCPTLLLLGADDRMTPAGGAAALADTIAECRVVVMPTAGHMMMMEQPDETLDIVSDFFSPDNREPVE